MRGLRARAAIVLVGLFAALMGPVHSAPASAGVGAPAPADSSPVPAASSAPSGEVAPVASPPATSPAEATSSQASKALPTFVLRDRFGHKVVLKRYLRKRPLLLYLFSIPRPQSARDLTTLEMLKEKGEAQPVVVHGDRSRRDHAIEIVQTAAIAYPVLFDNGGVAKWYGTSRNLTLILIAPDGHEAARWSDFSRIDDVLAPCEEALRAFAPPVSH